ncbi:MAG: hypothetical protein JXB47_01615 [Anaerolineae bacterium]|nr:hypothetical protein [Anaerolineae bacterium]
MSNRNVEVRIDDRVRLLSAVLAATCWPDEEQKRKPHGTHAHARGTRRVLAGFVEHPAIQTMQLLIDKGAPLEAFYTYIMGFSWPRLEPTAQPPPWVPSSWHKQLWHLYEVAGLDKWWEEEQYDWSEAATTAENVLQGVDFHQFLEQFIGPVTQHFSFNPNISYPTDTEIGVRLGNEICCIAPPRIAWGDNPPWPFDEDPAHVYRAALTQYGRLLILGYLAQYPDAVAKVSSQPLPINEQFAAKYPTFNERFVALFMVGAVGVFLEEALSEREAKAYVLMQTKVEGLKVLPGMVSVLRRYLEGRADGRWDELREYLPHFSNHLRVAKTITTL